MNNHASEHSNKHQWHRRPFTTGENALKSYCWNGKKQRERQHSVSRAPGGEEGGRKRKERRGEAGQTRCAWPLTPRTARVTRRTGSEKGFKLVPTDFRTVGKSPHMPADQASTQSVLDPIRAHIEGGRRRRKGNINREAEAAGEPVPNQRGTSE